MKFVEWMKGDRSNQVGQAQEAAQPGETFKQRQQASLAQESGNEPKPEQMTAQQRERAVDSVRNVASIVKDDQQQTLTQTQSIDADGGSTNAAERTVQGATQRHTPSLSPTDGSVAKNYLERDSQSHSTSRSQEQGVEVPSPTPTPTPKPPSPDRGPER